MPGEPHWRKSDPPLKNHTRAVETEATYTLQVWPDPPNEEEATDQDQMYSKGMGSPGQEHKKNCCCGSCQSRQR